mgnify:CR=1 FL=1
MSYASVKNWIDIMLVDQKPDWATDLHSLCTVSVQYGKGADKKFYLRALYLSYLGQKNLAGPENYKTGKLARLAGVELSVKLDRDNGVGFMTPACDEAWNYCMEHAEDEVRY